MICKVARVSRQKHIKNDFYGLSCHFLYTSRYVNQILHHIFSSCAMHFWHVPVCIEPRICVVAWRSKRTNLRCVFWLDLAVLSRSPRRRGVKSSKIFEKNNFLGVPGGENAYFRSERPNPIKNRRSKGGTPPNRPPRI